MALQAIGVVSSIPAAGVKPGTGAAVGSLFLSNGNSVRVLGKVTAGTGRIFLLRWESDLDEWRPWRFSQAITITGTEVSGLFDAIFATEKSSSNHFLLFADPAITVASAHAEPATY